MTFTPRPAAPRLTSAPIALLTLLALVACGDRTAAAGQDAPRSSQKRERQQPAPRRANPAASAAAPRFDPPADSPLGKKVHPRLFIVADGAGSVGVQLTPFRERLRKVHHDAFQTYIDAIDAQRSVDPARKTPGTLVTDGIGFALLALVDPRANTFRAAASASDYASLAKAHALVMAGMLAKGEGDTDDLEQINQRRAPTSLGAALVYDWTARSGVWTETDRQQLANGFIGAFDARMKRQWRAKFAMSEGNPSRIQAGAYGALAMWGDAIGGTASTGRPFDAEMQRLLDQIHADWYDYLQPTLEFLLQGRSGWPEGPNYAQEAYNSTTLTVGGLSTALNDNIFKSSGYVHYWPLWVLANMRPTPLTSDRAAVMKMNTSAVRDSVTFGDYGRTLYATAAMLSTDDPRISSLSRWLIEHYQLEPPKSDLYVRGYWWLWRFIWGYEHLPPAKSPEELGIPRTLKHGLGAYTMRSGYGSTSDTAILFWATETGANIGGHAAITNSSFTIEKFGNLVIEGGNRKNGGGTPHVSSQLDFALMGVYKPGEQSVEGQSAGNYMGMKYQRGEGDNPACSVERCGIGHVLSEAINRPDYDFVSFDYTRSWDPAKVTRASRDFLYLHPSGGGEYAVVVDRVTAANPSFQKRWHIKVPFDLEVTTGGAWQQAPGGSRESVTAPEAAPEAAPAAGATPQGRAPRGQAGASSADKAAAAAKQQARREERAAQRAARAAARGRTPRGKAATTDQSEPSGEQTEAPRAGRRRVTAPHEPVPGGVWEAPGSATLRMVNRYGPAHGVLFVRSLGPSGTTFRKIGGDGYEFRDADLANYNRDTPPFLTDDAADVMGRYRLEIIPGTAAASDVFVTLLQFGDANQLTQMTPASQVTVSSGGMAGVAVMDPAGARVLLFSSDPGAAAPSSRVVYTVTGARSPVHVLFNMRPGATYYVATKASGDATEVTVSPETFAGGTAVAADQEGILSFGPDGRQAVR